MTTSFELSKALYEKGLKIETEKFYCDISRQWREEEPHFELYQDSVAKSRQYNSKDQELQYPAPSTDELLAVMPYKINKIDYLAIRKAYEGYYIQYWDYESEAIKIKEDSLPGALGLMCLWLLKNGYCYNPETKMIERIKV